MNETNKTAKPTIAELEAILAEDNCTITVNPDGSISAIEKPVVHRLEDVLGSGVRQTGTY